MGSILSDYNPFTVYGQYNIKTIIYENKRSVIIFSVVFIIVLIGFIIVLLSDKTVPTSKEHYEFPTPKYGFGPFGHGLYLPPKNLIVNSVNS